jgi:hypothetical protein
MLMQNGGRIGPLIAAPSVKSASGIWSPDEASQAMAKGMWPVGNDASFSSVSAVYNMQKLASDGRMFDGSSKLHDAFIFNNSITTQSGLVTTQAVYGATSMAAAGAGGLYIPTHADFNLSTGDWTVEGWFYFTSIGTAILFDQAVGVGWTIYVYTLAGGTLKYYSNGADRITSAAGVLTTGTWIHVAASRVSGSTYLYSAGTQRGTTFADANTYVQGPFGIGMQTNTAFPITGFVGPARITKGVGRYSGASHTVPAGLFPES